MKTSNRKNIHWNARIGDTLRKPVYRYTRTRKPFNKFAWTKKYCYHSSEYGYLCLLGIPDKESSKEYRVTFKRNQKRVGWCGYNPDRHRFMCERAKRYTPMFRGTWKYNEYYS